MINLKPLSEKRWAHCKSVADFSRKLALHWNAEPTKAYLAGLLHDISRELPKEAFIPLAKAYQLPIDRYAEQTPILLHGAVSAVIAKENYGIVDREIASAMTKHTVGDKAMSDLDKIIYIADKIEPLRNYEGVEDLRILAFQSLNKTLLATVNDEERYLKEKGLTIHPRTGELKDELLKELNTI